MRTPIIMPVRARADLTINALTSCLAQDVPVLVRLVFNGAPPEVVQEVRDWLALQSDAVTVQARILEQPIALSALWNEELFELFMWSAEQCLVINNDVELRPDTVRFLSSCDGGIVTGVGVHSKDMLEWDGTERRRPHPDFSCFMIRRWAYALAGPFDETFQPAFNEDQDMHRRFQVLQIPCDTVGIPFLHVGGGSQTVKSDMVAKQAAAEWAELRLQYYHAKWGKLWPDECFPLPFNA